MAYTIQDSRSGNTSRYSPSTATNTNPLGAAATSATTPSPTPSTPPAYMPQNPLVPNPQVYKPTYGAGTNYATLDTANQMAKIFGGTVRETYSGLPNASNGPQYQIVMPNGAVLNAGAVANTLYPSDPNLSAISPDQRLAQIMADIQTGAGDFNPGIVQPTSGGFQATPADVTASNTALQQYYKSLGLNPSGLANNATPAQAFGINTKDPLMGQAPTTPQAQQFATPTNNVGQQNNNQNNQNQNPFNNLSQNALMSMLLNMFNGGNNNAAPAATSTDPFMQVLLLSLLGGNFMNPQYTVGTSPLGYTQWML